MCFLPFVLLFIKAELFSATCLLAFTPNCRKWAWSWSLGHCCTCHLTIWYFGVVWSSSVTTTWVTLHSPVKGQGLVRHSYEDSQGSRPLFVCLVTREETRDRIPVIDERREWRWKEGLSGSLRSVSICLCFHGVNGFVGHSPSRSAEVYTGCIVLWKCWCRGCT